MWVLLRNDGFCQNIRHISYEFFENVQNHVFVRWLCTCVYILCYCRCVAGLLAVGGCSLPPCFLTMSLLFCTSCSHPEIQRSRLPLHLLLVLPPRITQHLIWQLLHLLELHARRDLCLILVDDLPNRIHHIIQLLLAKPRRRLESPITSVNSYHHYAPLPNEKKSEPKSSKVQKQKIESRKKKKEKRKHTHLLNNQLQRNPRRGPHIINLQILRLIEPILGRQSAQQRVGTLIQRHGARRMPIRDLL